jgi:hypothetical protein
MALFRIGDQDTHIAATRDVACRLTAPGGNWCTRPAGHKGLHTTVQGTWGRGGKLIQIFDSAFNAFTEIDYEMGDGPFGCDVDGRW